MIQRFHHTCAQALLLMLLACVDLPASAADKDPLEGLNRQVFAFNEFLDSNLLKPLAQGYRAVTPGFIDAGISNFFANLGEVPAFVNHLLQGRAFEAGTDGGRFVVNSTLGLLGLVDVASKFGIEQHDTDLGVTLGRWGVRPGPYLVVPLLGPSSVRDGVGRGGDLFLHPLYYVEDEATRWSLRGIEVVDLRANLLEVEELISGDRYTFMRDLYLQRRDFLVSSAAGGDELEDVDFSDDEFGDEEF
jgi:phospholipid-binding lipoprotein MlaA